MRTTPLRTDRRRVLLGLGALALAPAAVGVLGSPAYAGEDVGEVDARGYETPPAPTCLADLIESGEVSRGDLMAG